MSIRYSSVILSALLLALVLSAGSATAASVLVIAHKAVPTDSISRNELRDIYLGDVRRWEDGTSIVVFDTKPRNETKETFYSYIGESSSRMKSIWIKKLLSGEGDPPETAESDAEAVRQIASTPGAVGFVAKGTEVDSVKVLAEINSEGDE